MRPTTLPDTSCPTPAARSQRDREDDVELSAARAWAVRLFGQARLGDARLTRRLVEVAAVCAARPVDGWPQAHEDWASTKGAYRLIENDRVTEEAIMQSACQSTARRCLGQGVVFCIQDTTTLIFPRAREAAADLGGVMTQDLPGLFLHSTLALRQNGVPLGLLDGQTWTRDPDTLGQRKRNDRPFEERESAKWLKGIQAAERAVAEAAGQGPQPRLIHIMDRESDIYEIFRALDERPNCGGVIRAMHNRRVSGEQARFEKANEQVRRQAPLGLRGIDLPRNDGRPPRQASTVVRSCRVELAPALQARRSLVLWLIEVLEENPPPGIEPLHWRLWSTEPAGSLAEALAIVAIYEKRWKIEDFHKALKSGCRIEDMRLHTAARLRKALAIYAAVAARILELRDLARIQPTAPCTEALSEIEWRALWTAIHHAPPEPHAPPPDIRQAVLWIGRLGGHLNRKGDGMPGITTLWRGWRDLELLANIYHSLMPRAPNSKKR